ncbi:ribbon-helix-helix domain-containing protein [Thioclava sp. DLFJ5-1]|uniref:ribbon-helix-helix domain-containing protein n=1 Tax=Thioclava sp. DLFJ5-1 TaxID=1915314 RepID=UPI00117EE375|nr:ribbon-helix-helix domain-containing protein [Thioclava sp. DLFJ5-1]
MEKKKVGRPPVDTEAVTLRLPRDMIKALDDRRRLAEDLPSRPEMIRRALAQWLSDTENDN